LTLTLALIACKPTNLPVKITNTCKIIDVWHNWLALYCGTINIKLTIWSFDTWADGDMRVWHIITRVFTWKENGTWQFHGGMRVWRWIRGQ
jgi:hypothetical protein